MARILYQADADLNEKIVLATTRLEPGIDFRTAHSAGLAGIDDLRVLGIAAGEGRILVSHDKATMPGSFAEFVATRSCAGIFIVRRGVKIRTIAEDLVLVWAASDPAEWVDQITYIPL